MCRVNCKLVSFVIIGALTLAYCIVEIVVALYMDSLTLLSDGFHNFSDVIALLIAFYAAKVYDSDEPCPVMNGTDSRIIIPYNI
tara:strand:- start:1155 stop:1406 length:252 start_codon:yes stop_codon:yes gene_type:complete